MADIKANVVISMPAQLFTASRALRALANGTVYVGRPDADPTLPENQIQVYVEQEPSRWIFSWLCSSAEGFKRHILIESGLINLRFEYSGFRAPLLPKVYEAC